MCTVGNMIYTGLTVWKIFFMVLDVPLISLGVLCYRGPCCKSMSRAVLWRFYGFSLDFKISIIKVSQYFSHLAHWLCQTTYITTGTISIDFPEMLLYLNIYWYHEIKFHRPWSRILSLLSILWFLFQHFLRYPQSTVEIFEGCFFFVW